MNVNLNKNAVIQLVGRTLLCFERIFVWLVKQFCNFGKMLFGDWRFLGKSKNCFFDEILFAFHARHWSRNFKARILDFLDDEWVVRNGKCLGVDDCHDLVHFKIIKKTYSIHIIMNTPDWPDLLGETQNWNYWSCRLCWVEKSNFKMIL